MNETEKDILHRQFIDFCSNKCEYQKCVECQNYGKLDFPYCKFSYIDEAYQVIDTKTLSCDIEEILEDIRLDFYKKDQYPHSAAIITKLTKNKRYKFIKKGDDEKL